MPTRDEVMEKLRFCYDPEIPLNIVDLGLIYNIEVEEGDVRVEMTLTAQGCPSHTEISRDVKMAVLGIPGVNTADVRVVWDPPWTRTASALKAGRSWASRTTRSMPWRLPAAASSPGCRCGRPRPHWSSS